MIVHLRLGEDNLGIAWFAHLPMANDEVRADEKLYRVTHRRFTLPETDPPRIEVYVESVV